MCVIISSSPFFLLLRYLQVSQGAEAIRINKAFFLKFADERVFTQIEMRVSRPLIIECFLPAQI